MNEKTVIKDKRKNTKKYLIVLILKILETNTDKKHLMTQTEIAKLISEVYPCDRKTVGRNIKFLIELEYPIKKTSKGFYMDKKQFTSEDIDFIVEAIRDSKKQNTDYKENLLSELIPILHSKYKNIIVKEE